PRLYKKRLDDFGIDFSIVYPSLGLGFIHVSRDDVRIPACMAYNRYVADAFADVADRITPAAIMPMHTPDEAIAVLDDAVMNLGLKAVMMGSFAKRPVVRDGVEEGPWAWWLDFFGIDSAYDYDPLWRRMVELGVSAAAHSGSMGIGTRQSPTNFMYNHIGHFAATGEALAKSLVMGGVAHGREPVGRQAGGRVRLGHWSLGRTRSHDRPARGLRSGRTRTAGRERVPRVRLRQRALVLHGDQPQVLRGNRGRLARSGA